MSRFNTKNTTKTTNLAGGKSYKHGTEMELVTSVLTTFLENKFYESGNDRIDRIKQLVRYCDDIFVAKLAFVTRKNFNLRSVFHLLVAELSRKHRGDNLVSNLMEKAVERPDDILEIVALLDKPLPKQIRLGIKKSLKKFNSYLLAKYQGKNKKFSLKNVLKLIRPNPKDYNEDLQNAFKQIIKDELKCTKTWEARLSSGEDKDKVWHDLVLENKIGYMALLRNLRNINNQADEQTKQKACELISNRELVLKSKQLPFRFFNAFENVTNNQMLNAIAQATDIALDNVPIFDGKTLVAVDSSGSMEGDPINKASMLASALYKSNNADLILYDTRVKFLATTNLNPVITIAQQIKKEAMGGGTDTSLVFRYCAEYNKKYDRIIILSDNESWCDSRYDNGTNAIYQQVKNEIGNPFVYAIDIEGYGTKDLSDNKVFHLAGFSEAIFDFMKWIEKENQLVDFIKSVEL